MIEALVDVKITMTLYNQETTSIQMTMIAKKGEDVDSVDISWIVWPSW